MSKLSMEQQICQMIEQVRKYGGSIDKSNLYMNAKTRNDLFKEASDEGYYFGEKYRGFLIIIDKTLADDQVFFKQEATND